MSDDDIDWEGLRAEASRVRGQAYAPYSSYPVGAALLAEDGRVFCGANIENVSIGLSLCAERSAVAAAVAAGQRRFAALAIVAAGRPEPPTPCGMCRQVLAEFPPPFPVRCYTPEGELLETDVASLLPHAFPPGPLGSES